MRVELEDAGCDWARELEGVRVMAEDEAGHHVLGALRVASASASGHSHRVIRGRARAGGWLGVIIIAGEEADGFVSALDSESRDVFVLLYDSEEAQSDVAGEREVGLRGDKLLIYSAEIGPEDRTAIEECFIAE